jgi:periplasmic divalent cation tolerance protein
MDDAATMTPTDARLPPLIWVQVAVPLAHAEGLARRCVEARLAACVSIVPGLRSVYRWQGQVETAAESLLVIKTRGSHYPALEALIKAHHPYELPEIVAVPVTLGSEPYLEWIVRETA